MIIIIIINKNYCINEHFYLANKTVSIITNSTLVSLTYSKTVLLLRPRRWALSTTLSMKAQIPKLQHMFINALPTLNRKQLALTTKLFIIN
jgi:hypothetical protein